MHCPDVLNQVGPERSAMGAVGADMWTKTRVCQQVAFTALTQISATKLLPTHLAHQQSLAARGHTTHHWQQVLEWRHQPFQHIHTP